MIVNDIFTIGTGVLLGNLVTLAIACTILSVKIDRIFFNRLF